MLKRKLVDSKSNPVYKRLCLLTDDLSASYLAVPCRDIRQLLDAFVPKTPALNLSKPISALYMLGDYVAGFVAPNDELYCARPWDCSRDVHVFNNEGVLLRSIHLDRALNRYRLAVAPTGDLYVSDDLFHVVVFTPRGRFKQRLGPFGIVAGLAIHNSGTKLAVLTRYDSPNVRLYSIEKQCRDLIAFSVAWTRPDKAQAISWLFNDRLVILYQWTISIYTEDGTQLLFAFSPWSHHQWFVGLHVTSTNEILILDNRNTLTQFDTQGQIVATQELRVPGSKLRSVDRFSDGRIVLLGKTRKATLNKKY